MNYFEKIIKNAKSYSLDLPSAPSMAIPHQAFSPREILAQFVRNDLQVVSHEPDDSVQVPDDYDGVNFVDRVQFFEDEFEARERVNQIKEDVKLSRRKNEKSKNAKTSDVVVASDSNFESATSEASSVVSQTPTIEGSKKVD